jgi:hypothetical protein
MGKEQGVSEERHDTAFVVGTILGSLAGAAVTLFNVPRSGAETRAQLKRLAQDLTEPARRLGDGVQGRVVDALTQRTSYTDEVPATPDVATPDLQSDPLTPVGADLDATALAGAPLSGAGETDIVIDGPRPADSASQG